MPNPSLGLIDILRSVLRRLDDESIGGTADPALRQVKQNILRSVAQLDLERNSLKAPDVVVAESELPRAAQSPQDSVVVLVAPRPRKPCDTGDKTGETSPHTRSDTGADTGTGTGGQSSAA